MEVIKQMKYHNPILNMDFPDPDVIRVGDTYYMVSTTMHFFPGCVILRSYDLVHWETASYVYDTLDNTDGQRLLCGKHCYGQGMWAASLRYHNGLYYVVFVANDTHQSYLYTAEDVQGRWKRHEIKGFYHDCSLFFDDDESVYLVYGNTEIHLTQMKPDLSGPLAGGIDRVIIREEGNPQLGYEGSHMYKRNGKYYVFLIHSRKDRWMRTEACFYADDLRGEFSGKDVLEDTMGYCGQGVAQGGIVETPEGDWYAVLFQDSGAVGRIPVLVPVHWEDDFPVFGIDKKVPHELAVTSTRADYVYAPLYGPDDFSGEPLADGSVRLKDFWQFNHTPDTSLWEIREKQFRIRTGKCCHNPTQAQNTLTQRLVYPKSTVCVTVDFSGLQEGDYAGLCALQGCYAFAAVKIEKEMPYLVMGAREAQSADMTPMAVNDEPGTEYARIPLTGSRITLRMEADFTKMRDVAQFSYATQDGWKQIGPLHQLHFKLDHFCGCRAGLFAFSTKQAGGVAGFSDFRFETED